MALLIASIPQIILWTNWESLLMQNSTTQPRKAVVNSETQSDKS